MHMEKEKMYEREVGKIVAGNYAAARVFAQYGIDFCCHGDTPLEAACAGNGVSVEEVTAALEAAGDARPVAGEFASWPLDLLIDYILKIHHRGIRREGPGILELLEKVESVHGSRHPELHEVKELFAESLQELEQHLQKEENVLFPYLLELFEASEAGRPIGQMHCGTVSNPIRVMRMEHEGEGDRYHRVAGLTNNFTAPDDGCASYRLVMQQLKEFVDALYEHIHLENNILFPKAVELERKWVRVC